MTPDSMSKQVVPHRSSRIDLALLALMLFVAAAFSVHPTSAFGNVVVVEPTIAGSTGSVHQVVKFLHRRHALRVADFRGAVADREGRTSRARALARGE